MSKQRSAPAPRGRRLPVPWPVLVLLVVAVIVAAYSVLAPPARAGEHPEPRAGVTAARVQPPERYADDPRIARVYAEVAEIAAVVDGVYCNCHCSRHSGHYSLLSCFESDHGAACDVCLESAHLAYTMTRQGATLDQVRDAVQQRYGNG